MHKVDLETAIWETSCKGRELFKAFEYWEVL